MKQVEALASTFFTFHLASVGMKTRDRGTGWTSPVCRQDSKGLGATDRFDSNTVTVAMRGEKMIDWLSGESEYFKYPCNYVKAWRQNRSSSSYNLHSNVIFCHTCNINLINGDLSYLDYYQTWKDTIVR